MFLAWKAMGLVMHMAGWQEPGSTVDPTLAPHWARWGHYVLLANELLLT